LNRTSSLLQTSACSFPLPLLVSWILIEETVFDKLFLRVYVRLAGQTYTRHERHGQTEKDLDPFVCRRRSLNDVPSPLNGVPFRFLWRTSIDNYCPAAAKSHRKPRSNIARESGRIVMFTAQPPRHGSKQIKKKGTTRQGRQTKRQRWGSSPDATETAIADLLCLL
jgi:hypothetical protein